MTVRSACAVLLALVCLAGCERAASESETPEVVLYSSADDYVLREVVADFERATGIDVRLVGDTEATKTTGLVTRLRAETDDPQADVWWSSEPFGTIALAREGVLDPATAEILGDRRDQWPARLVGRDGSWVGIAQRARVLGYSTTRTPEPPTTLAELTAPEWRGRVGIARPQFGTTRGHMAMLVEAWGPEAFEAWLAAMRDNGLRIYDGNATVVRKIAEGEIDVGLTDTDDVWVAQRNGWDVGYVFEATEPASEATFSTGPLLIPNTVSIVRGAPNPDAARRLAEYLILGPAERILRASDSRNYPVKPEVEPNAEAPSPESPAAAPLDDVADRVDEAMAICERVLG
ncbi:MAG: extracellular solute-binding protein [Phycisphaerales bacterium]